MKFICSIFLALVLVGKVSAQSDTVSFGWDPSPTPVAQLREYNLYFTKDTNLWTHVKPVGLNTQATVQLDTIGRWYFVAVAVGTNGIISPPSNMVIYDVTEPPLAASKLKLLSAIVTRVSTITISTNIITVAP